jgi:hypothetical protein
VDEGREQRPPSWSTDHRKSTFPAAGILLTGILFALGGTTRKIGLPDYRSEPHSENEFAGHRDHPAIGEGARAEQA